uniref:Uncharacterized protein n=1 Tax=viral metagenome TaxID=1070528 RepID=A0A6C0BDT6_9ZZZZ
MSFTDNGKLSEINHTLMVDLKNLKKDDDNDKDDKDYEDELIEMEMENDTKLTKIEEKIKELETNLKDLEILLHMKVNRKKMLRSKNIWEETQIFNLKPEYHNEKISASLAYGCFVIPSSQLNNGYSDASLLPLDVQIDNLQEIQYVSSIGISNEPDFTLFTGIIRVNRSGLYKISISANVFSSSIESPSIIGLYAIRLIQVSFDEPYSYVLLAPKIVVKNAPINDENYIASDADCETYNVFSVVWISAGTDIALLNKESRIGPTPRFKINGNENVNQKSLFTATEKPICILFEMLSRSYVV